MSVAEQLTLDHITSSGVPLHQATFVVVDLETDGGAPADAGITEIGAVKVRAGEVLGTFQTLVRVGRPLPPFIRALTGITDEMLATAPDLASALAAFLEFAHGSVLVAHNAPYDVGFLKGACAKVATTWPEPPVIDTARIARAALTRDEVPNRKLATLARHFRASVQPTHRALDDALATVDVLHGLMERVGNLGVHTLPELQGLSVRVPDARRRKRVLADGLPLGPGVYIFEDDRGTALYVGTSRSIRRRVLNYFTAAEQRPRMNEMVGIASRVVAVPCATALEAQIQELRTIAARAPRYNRRSARPHTSVWLKLTAERFPRLSVVGQVRGDHERGARYVGPFSSRRAAQNAAEAVEESFPLRSCTQVLSGRPKSSACVLLDLGRCSGPCVGAISQDDYEAIVERTREALTKDSAGLAEAVGRRIAQLAAAQRYEEAGAWRDRLALLLRTAAQTEQSDALGQIPHLLAARPTDDAGWEMHVIRHGRLAAAGIVAPGVDPRPAIPALIASAQSVAEPPRPASAALPEETAILTRWLHSPGVRLVELDGGPLASAARGPASLRSTYEIDIRDPMPD